MPAAHIRDEDEDKDDDNYDDDNDNDNDVQKTNNDNDIINNQQQLFLAALSRSSCLVVCLSVCWLIGW